MRAEWKAVMGGNPCIHAREIERPVENVSWKDVQKFTDEDRKRIIVCRPRRNGNMPAEVERQPITVLVTTSRNWMSMPGT
jgi:hypothetical protein